MNAFQEFSFSSSLVCYIRTK